MDLSGDGYTVIPGVIDPSVCEAMVAEIDAAFTAQSDGAIETRRGGLVGGRNLIDSWSGWRRCTEHSAISHLIEEHVGAGAGLVRILYFDKPPGQSWALSLHQDKTIAVAEHHDPPAPFSKPTRKAGVPHVEVTDEWLKRILTLRLHLDAMHEENGPLVVVPRSHAELSRTSDQAMVPIHCEAGDVFVMRPLLLHGSRAAAPSTTDHRRVVHLEMAAGDRLPSPYRWHRFVPLA